MAYGGLGPDLALLRIWREKLRSLDSLGLRKTGTIDVLKNIGNAILDILEQNFSIVGLDNSEPISVYRRRPKGTISRRLPSRRAAPIRSLALCGPQASQRR